MTLLFIILVLVAATCLIGYFKLCGMHGFKGYIVHVAICLIIGFFALVFPQIA